MPELITTTPPPDPSSSFPNLTNPGWLEYGVVIGVTGLLLLGCIYFYCTRKQVVLSPGGVINRGGVNPNYQEMKMPSVFGGSIMDSLKTSVMARIIMPSPSSKCSNENIISMEEQRESLLPSSAASFNGSNNNAFYRSGFGGGIIYHSAI
jgi:hypothetical protein